MNFEDKKGKKKKKQRERENEWQSNGKTKKKEWGVNLRELEWELPRQNPPFLNCLLNHREDESEEESRVQSPHLIPPAL